MTTRRATFRNTASIIVFLVTFQLIGLDLLAAEKDKTKLKDKMRSLMQGIPLGKNTRLFPYASLDDWFDPYGGLLLQHPGFRSSEDRVAHHIKFEAARDFSWKIRYLANSLSSGRTHFQFLLKTKLDRDPFFYGLGNETTKEDRIRATYGSIFVGAALAQKIGSHVLYTWSPGVWHFKSGLETGGEFEEASSAFYVTSRFSISDKTRLDYKKKSFANYWSGYIEVGVPANSVAWYARINFETITRIRFFKNHKFTVGNRIEFLLSEDKKSVPYFAIPETGSRSGLRGFAKERFRDFALSVLHFEYSIPLVDEFEGFVLTDIAKTSSKFQLFPGENSHVATGFGLRFLNKNNPISVGIAKSNEGWKVFSAIATGKPW